MHFGQVEWALSETITEYQCIFNKTRLIMREKPNFVEFDIEESAVIFDTR